MRITLVSFLSFFLCYWIFLSIYFSVTTSQCLKDQQSLLLQLKNNFTFKPENSHKLKLWNQSIDCCNWSGVSCDNEGHVTGLDLSEELITGGFDNSSVLFSFHHLQKLNLAANNFNSVIPSGFNKLEKLTYLNLSYADFVGQIPIEISQLTRLVTLDISSGLELKLENPNLQKLVQNLTSIRQLYLDGVSITAPGHEWCSALTSLHDLQELSMSLCNLSGPLNPSLAGLENLSVIVLDENSLSSPVPETFAHLKNLTILSLAFCGLTGTFPQKIFQIGTLQFIDISFNYNLQGFIPDFPQIGSLNFIRVSNTSFSRAFPHSIGNMKHLSQLDLSNCQFSGTLPNSLSNLTEIRYLYLSFNNFTGPIPSFGMTKKLIQLDLSHNSFSGTIPSTSHFAGLDNLFSIDLGFNSINGSIPSSLFTLPLLQWIQISNNHFSQLDDFVNVSTAILNTLDLSCNNLSGHIPAFIFQLSKLSSLQLSSNKFSGSMQLYKLLGLRNLTALDLSYNNLSVNVNVINAGPSSFPSISNLKLASCNLKNFPDFLRNQSSLVYLDLSDNQIQGKVPNWIWKLQNLHSLNISHNFLTDLEGPLENLTSYLIVLDLHHNELQGSIPYLPTYASYLDYSSNKFRSSIPQDIGNYLSSTIFLSLSNNTFHGSIPDSLCQAASLQVLDLSNNFLTGRIPKCLIAMNGTLSILDLGRNKLNGTIDTFPGLCSLRTLHLNGNSLQGKLPKYLSNCGMLEILDIGDNQIHDQFPCWLKNISTLRVLILSSNKFHGSLKCGRTEAAWPLLQIFDLASNNFSGRIPLTFFETWKAMIAHKNDGINMSQLGENLNSFTLYYQDRVMVTIKEHKVELVKILTIFTTIDLSCNKFEGVIPQDLGLLNALYILNLSHNAFFGPIPSSLGNMKELESLDLSYNCLRGEIPTEITKLSFLSLLNLSFNHLLGRIPTGTQIQSFAADSFKGNDGLCGPPLSQNGCGDRVQETEPTTSNNSIDWNFISIEVGFAFGIGIIIFPILFYESGRKRYWKYMDHILYYIFPQLDFVHQRRGEKSYKTLRWNAY